MKTTVLKHSFQNAAAVIREGGVVAVPTETVYGLAANALDPAAVERVFAAKGRPENKPVSLFVTGMTMAEEFCRDIPEAAYLLAERFWPGPLTIILKRCANVPDSVTAGGDTVGVRCPDDALTLGLLREAGVPLTGTSANRSGEPDALCIEDVLRCLDGRIPCAIDGGPARGGVPSTVLDLTVSPPHLLRQGGVTREALEAVLGEEIL